MPKFEDNPSPYLTVVEQTTPANPSSGRQKLFIDSADHKLKQVNSSGTVVTAGGSGSIIFRQEFTAAAAASLVVNSGITDTYQMYEIRFDMAPATDNVQWRIELSTDGGATWLNTGYRYGGMVQYSNAFSAVVSNNAATIYSFGEAGNAAGEHIVGKLQLMNPRTTDQQLIMMEASEITQQPYFAHHIQTLGHTTTSKINAVRFTMSSGNVTGKARLYGVVNA